jgi:hypothetical protein
LREASPPGTGRIAPPTAVTSSSMVASSGVSKVAASIRPYVTPGSVSNPGADTDSISVQEKGCKGREPRHRVRYRSAVLTAYIGFRKGYNHDKTDRPRLIYSVSCKAGIGKSKFMRPSFIVREEDKMLLNDTETVKLAKRERRYSSLVSCQDCYTHFPDHEGIVDIQKRQACCRELAWALSGIKVANFDEC